MKTDTYQGTATIYQFPVRGRGGVADRLEGGHGRVEPKTHIGDSALGACWYHEAAVIQAAGTIDP